MQKGRVMLRAAGGIPYELTRGRVKRLNLHAASIAANSD